MYYFFTSTVSASVTRANIPGHANFHELVHVLTDAEAVDETSTTPGAVTGEQIADAVAAHESGGGGGGTAFDLYEDVTTSFPGNELQQGDILVGVDISASGEPMRIVTALQFFNSIYNMANSAAHADDDLIVFLDISNGNDVTVTTFANVVADAAAVDDGEIDPDDPASESTSSVPSVQAVAEVVAEHGVDFVRLTHTGETLMLELDSPDGTAYDTSVLTVLGTVASDATLTGTGKTTSPMGVADDGIGPDQIADDAVTVAKMDSETANDGWVVTADGSGGVEWEPQSGGGGGGGGSTDRTTLVDAAPITASASTPQSVTLTSSLEAGHAADLLVRPHHYHGRGRLLFGSV